MKLENLSPDVRHRRDFNKEFMDEIMEVPSEECVDEETPEHSSP